MVLLLVAVMLLTAPGTAMQAAAAKSTQPSGGAADAGDEGDTGDDEDTGKAATKKEKSQAYSKLYTFCNNLKVVNSVDEETAKGLDDICYNATNYIAGNKEMTAAEVEQYIIETQEQLEQYVSNKTEDEPGSTSEFLLVGDCVPTIVGKSGTKMHVILPIYNIGPVMIKDLLVTPVVSAQVSEWPFVIGASGYNKMVDNIPGNATLEDAYKNRREVSWDLDIRKDAPTGYYNLQFEVSYYRNGGMENATLSMYVYVEGAPENGKLDSEETEVKGATPRIIVTGFETTPENVFAGETFNITIHVKNTSNTTALSNILFELEAAEEGSDEENTYQAFLPTSGSNSIFMDQISAGGTADVKLEMEAKADLGQKPYVLDIKMEFEDASFNSYNSTGSISVPVKQQSKFDISSFDVMPGTIPVGSESNIMFSIYNTGKTTLYNTQVKFVSDSIEGGDTFVGKIEAGGSGNVDAMVTGTAIGTSDAVKVIVSYEDEAGVVTEKEFETKLMVIEEQDLTDTPDDGIYEEEGQSSKLPIILTLLLVIILAVAAVVIILVRKKKKAAKELTEDLEEFDDDDDFLSEEEK